MSGAAPDETKEVVVLGLPGAVPGSGTVTVLGESQAGWDCTLAATGGTILVQVTGAAGNSVTWNWSGKTLAGKE